jgi:hypothetical protein
MSRGPGNLQRLLLAIISQQAKPMTMAEIVTFLMQQTGVNDPDRKAHPTVLRKLYRSLKALCDVGAVVALGDGGPGDPKRYCLNPLIAPIGGSKEQYDRAQAIFQSDPGANIAAARMMAAIRIDPAFMISPPFYAATLTSKGLGTSRLIVACETPKVRAMSD